MSRTMSSILEVLPYYSIATQQVTPTMETRHSLHSQQSQGSNQYGSYNNIENTEGIDN